MHQQLHRRLGRSGATCQGRGARGAAAATPRVALPAMRATAAQNGNPATPEIKLIVTDVDGTLLNSQQKLTKRVELAARAAADAGVPLVVATGKARGEWTDDAFPRLKMSMPGIFLQGVLVCDVEGNIMWEQHMTHEAVQGCIDIATKHGVTLTLYTGRRIVAAALDEHTERLKFYHEPLVEAIGSLSRIAEERMPIQKLIFMAPQPTIDALRPEVEVAMQGKGSITSALTGMLEVLPLGVSKGSALEWLVPQLGLSMDNVMALGDGENDIEMLKLAGLAVAMGNAGPKARAVADVVVASNDEDGWADAVERFVLAPRGLSVKETAAR